ncbi:MAG: phage tail tape measure protein [Candidatus Bathyarchaeia archaeon]
MGKISASMGLMGMELQQLGPGFAQVGQMMQGFAVAGWTGAAVIGIGEVVQGIQQAVAAAAASQSAWAMLQQSLHLTGAAWAAQQPQIQNFVQGLEQVSTVSQTAAVQGLQLLATYGMNATQAEQALTVATNLSAAKNLDLTTAVNLVGKAFDGVTTTLSRYGIIIQTTTKANADLKQGTADLTAAIQKAGVNALQPFTQILQQAGISLTTTTGKELTATQITGELVTAWKAGTITTSQMNDITHALGINFDWATAKASDYNDIMAQLNDKFGSAAQTQLDTYAGKQQQLTNEWADLQIQIGDMLLPTLTSLTSWLDDNLPKFTSWITSLALDPSVQTTWSKFMGVFSGFVASGDLTELMGFVSEVAKGAIEVALDLAITGMDFLNAIMTDVKWLQSVGIIPMGVATAQTAQVIPQSNAPTYQATLTNVTPPPEAFSQKNLNPPTDQIFTGANQEQNAPGWLQTYQQDWANFTTGIQKGAQTAGQDLTDWWNGLWAKTTQDTTTGTDDVTTAAASGMGPLATTTLNIGNQINTNLGSTLWSKVTTAVQPVAAALSNTWSQIQSGAQAAFGAVTSGLAAIPSTKDITVSSVVSDAVTGFDQVTAVISTIPSMIETTVTTIADDAISVIQNVISWLDKIPSEIMTSINVSLSGAGLGEFTGPGYQLGGMVPTTGIYMLHGGEEVLTPAQQAAIGAGLTPPAAPTSQGGSGPMQLQNQTVVQLDGQTVASILEQKIIRQRKFGSGYKYTAVT